MSPIEPEPQSTENSAGNPPDPDCAPTATESEFLRSLRYNSEPPTAKILDVQAADANCFSPDDDTLTAIDELGIRLDPVTGKDVLGRMAHYEIIRCLGRGGMGTVFEAFDTRLFRPVAIKFMASSLAASSKARSRFLREARVAASINHPNVVTIHSVDEHEGRPYLVMEFVPGITLQDQVRNFGPMALGDVLRISRQIATGLRAAHEKGIVHRDIKPGNILLENGVQRVKIVDFGLAQVVFELSDITSQGQTLGTPRYMAPEQIEGSRVDERADLFSLGCVIYMLCCGQPPFSGNTYTILQNILREKQLPIHQAAPHMPQALSDLVEQMLSKSPDTRIQTAAEVENTLMEIARGGTPSDEYLRVPDKTPSRPNEQKPHAAGRFAVVSLMLGLATLLAVFAGRMFLSKNDPESLLSETTKKKNKSESVVQAAPPTADSPAGADTRLDAPLEERDPGNFTVGGAAADFHSLKIALLHVQAGDTLSVTGELPPNDTILLNNPQRHSNLSIDWATNIPLTVTASVEPVITVNEVSGVLIRDAVILVENTHAVSIHGTCAGLTLENCRLEQGAGSRQAVIAFWESARGSAESPIVLKYCDVIFFDLGIACIGSEASAVEWVRFEDNIFHGLQPEWGTTLVFEKSVRNIDVRRNRIESVRAGVSVRGKMEKVQLANNTFFEVDECYHPSPDSTAASVSVYGNLAVQCGAFATGIATDDKGLSFAFNKADVALLQPEVFEPVRDITFVSVDYQNEAFLAPLTDDQLRIAAAPSYVGAIEPRSDKKPSATPSDASKNEEESSN